ncbi:MAG TPA: VRR-NUC domain-containing protein [Candidatus Acidoferrales bacterium]|nr:VRR-NUC domain-containing protein [Candidatus Acidoferrales bacterium]
MNHPLIELGTFEYRRQQWDRFVSGELWCQWAKEYPLIFDEQDVQIAKNQAGSKMRYHFHEWLAAVLIFHTYGYLSLIEQYEFKVQARKREVIKCTLPPAVFNFVTDHKQKFQGVQCPDLFVYAPDCSDWFFCEVKGPTDDISKTQELFFDELAEVSGGKAVRIIRFRTAV